VSQRGESNRGLGKNCFKSKLTIVIHSLTQKYVWCFAQRDEMGLAYSVREKE